MIMRKIYTCRVDSDDRLEVTSDDSSHVGFSTFNDRASVFLNREDVARLRDALTEWLGDKPLMTPETLDERVREIVQDELRRIRFRLSGEDD